MRQNLFAVAALVFLVSSAVAQRYTGESFPVYGNEEDGLLIVLEDVEREDVFGVTDDYNSINWFADVTVVSGNEISLHEFGYEYSGAFAMVNGATLEIAIRGWAEDESLTLDGGVVSPFDLDQLEITGTYRDGNLINPFTASLPTIGNIITTRHDLELTYEFPPAPPFLMLDETTRSVVLYQFNEQENGQLPDKITLAPNLFISSIRIASWIDDGELLLDGFIRIPGDANLDGVFNSTDLIMVFSAGQYEDGVVANSVWETGDWNDDQEFDTGDLVTAFAAGGYVAGAVVAVPEPRSTAYLLWLALVPTLRTLRASVASDVIRSTIADEVHR